MAGWEGQDPSSLTGVVIGAAIEVHRCLGPGLLESVYQACLLHELGLQGVAVEAEVSISVDYKGETIDCGYRVDLLVEESLIVELKSVRTLDSVHVLQLLTYLKCSRKRLGLLINFNVPVLKHGIRRIVNPDLRPPPRPFLSPP